MLTFMQLIIISGLSGSGKSIALNMLEDADYYCVDNMPSQLLQQLVDQLAQQAQQLGLNSTPSILVNGKLMANPFDYNALSDEIAAAAPAD